jgi:glycosyltransferase involved in cell wall biosynthesis
MRIVLVTNGLRYGGAERVVQALAVDLAARGDEVHVVATTRDGPIGDALRACRIPVTVLAIRHPADVRVGFALAAILRRCGAEIVHSHLAVSDIATVVAGSFTRGTRTVTTVHSGYVGLGRLTRSAWRLALRRFDRVIAASEWVRTLLPSALAATVVRPSLAGPAAALDRAHARARLGVAADTPLVMAVGRLVPVKGFDVLAQATAMVKTAAVRTLVVGDGPARTHLACTGRLELLGGRDDAGELLAAADVVVSASRSEGFPQALVHAMAAGLPVVATDVGGTSELVVHRRTGLLIPPDDPTALAGAIDALLADRACAAALGAAGRARLREEGLTRSAMVEQTRAVYADVVRGG